MGMGKSSSPPTPDYKGAAIATANLNKFSDIGPNGSVGWSLRPGADPNNPQPGDYIRTTTLAPDQQRLQDAEIGNQLQAAGAASSRFADLAPDDQARQQLQDTLYRRSTQYYDKNFGQQEDALRTRLLNSGLTEGSEAYNNDMQRFGQVRDTAYADAADRATLGAEQQSQSNQSNAIARLAQLLSMSKGQSISPVNSGLAGPDLLGATDAGFKADLGAANADNAATGATMSTLLKLFMMI